MLKAGEVEWGSKATALGISLGGIIFLGPYLGSEDSMTIAIAASAPPLAQVSQIFSTRQSPSLFWPLSAIDSYFPLIVAYSNYFTLDKHNSGVWDMPSAMTTSKSSGLSISWFFSSFCFACAVIVPGFDG